MVFRRNSRSADRPIRIPHPDVKNLRLSHLQNRIQGKTVSTVRDDPYGWKKDRQMPKLQKKGLLQGEKISSRSELGSVSTRRARRANTLARKKDQAN